MIKIILADDHTIVRNGIRNVLEQDPLVKVIGEASDGQQVLDMIQAGVEVDIILADLNMPKLGVIELAEKVKNIPSTIKTMVLTVHDEQMYVEKAFQAGVSAYLFKNITADELLFAIKNVHEGRRYICVELATRLLDQVMERPTLSTTAINIELSERELMILKLIADGLTNKEIADKLFTSKRTVEGHRQAMINKAGVPNTPALIRFALMNNIIT